MPGDAITSTDETALPVPIGWVAAILTGNEDNGRTRVCEVVWLDAELFGESEGPLELVGVSEESYTSLGEKLGMEVAPGLLGEHLLFRELDFGALRMGVRLKIGDAKVQVSSTDENSVRFLLLEEGLVQPGSPVWVE